MSDRAQKVSALKAAFGTVEISRDGDDVSVKCPKCAKPGSSKKKLVINLNEGMYHCWVCGLKGRNVLRVVKMASHSAAEHPVFKKWSKPSRKDKALDEEAPEAEKLKIPAGFRLLGDNLGARDPDIKSVIRYCRKRGLTDREIWKYRLGTCTTSRFRRRVIVPSFTEEGKLNYYSARSIDDNKFKYINAQVSKKEIIFNEINIDWGQELVLVEGPFDLMKVRTNVGCLLGSHLPEDSALFQRIVKKQTPVLLALDDDAVHKMHKIAKTLTSYGVSVRYLCLPPERDVGDMELGEFEALKSSAVKWHYKHQLFSKIGEIRSGSLI